jgi:hypothetical protein
VEYRHGPVPNATPGRTVWILGSPPAGLPDDIGATGAPNLQPSNVAPWPTSHRSTSPQPHPLNRPYLTCKRSHDLPGPDLQAVILPAMASMYTALEEFLTEQRIRLSESSYRNYERVIGHLRSMFYSEGFNGGDERQQRLYEEMINKGTPESQAEFFRSLDACFAVDSAGYFVGPYMRRNVIDTLGVERAAVPTMKRLTKFLVDRKYIGQEMIQSVTDDIEDALDGGYEFDISQNYDYPRN